MPATIESSIEAAQTAVELVRLRYSERCGRADAIAHGSSVHSISCGHTLDGGETVDGSACPVAPYITVDAELCHGAIDTALAGFTTEALEGLHASPLAFIPALRNAFIDVRQTIDWNADWSREHVGAKVYDLLREIVLPTPVEAPAAQPRLKPQGAKRYRDAADSYNWAMAQDGFPEPPTGTMYTQAIWRFVNEYCDDYDAPPYATWCNYVGKGMKMIRADALQKSAP